MSLFHEYKDVLTPVLMEMIRETNCIVPPEDMQGILRKDAVYNAVSLATFYMYDDVSDVFISTKYFYQLIAFNFLSRSQMVYLSFTFKIKYADTLKNSTNQFSVFYL